MITIELYGSYNARCGDIVIERKKHDPVPYLCRVLLEQGEDGSEVVRVVRGDIEVFSNRLPVSWWADRDFVDTEARSAHQIRHREFSLQSANVNQPVQSAIQGAQAA